MEGLDVESSEWGMRFLSSRAEARSISSRNAALKGRSSTECDRASETRISKGPEMEREGRVRGLKSAKRVHVQGFNAGLKGPLF
jgi:hypothetical protein